MKKTLLATALVAGFAGAGIAHAESSVTLYGLVDAGYGFNQTKTTQGNHEIRHRHTGATEGTNVGDAGSRWGLRGQEDLGNGTSAIFQLESGFDVTNGYQMQRDGANKRDRLFGRQAYVGLSGDSWGTFTMGRQLNLGSQFIAPVDPYGAGHGLFALMNTFGNSTFDRYDASFKYVSPNFEGFKFGLQVSHDYTEDKVRNASGVYTQRDKTTDLQAGIGLSYNSGPLYLAATFDYFKDKFEDQVGGIKTEAKTKAWNIAGTYDFDVVKLHLIYGGQRDGAVGGNLGHAGNVFSYMDTFYNSATSADAKGKGLRQHSWLAGLSAPVGDAGTVLFSYQGNQVKHNDLPGLSADFRKANTHIFGLGYKHDLSKRTTVYANAGYGWTTGKFSDRSVNPNIKVKSTQAVVGLQHRF